MAGAIAVQQHDDVVNLSTISHKKTEYRFAFGKYVIHVSLWHLFGERSSISNQPSLYKGGSTSVSHKKRVHILISWSRVSDHRSKGCKIIGAGPFQR